MAGTSKVGKRGAVVLPAELRRRFNIEEGSLVVAEAREDGILIRPVSAPSDAEYRQWFFAELALSVAATKDDAAAWAAELAERQRLEGTLMDGLDPDEVWTADDVVPTAGPTRHA